MMVKRKTKTRLQLELGMMSTEVEEAAATIPGKRYTCVFNPTQIDSVNTSKFATEPGVLRGEQPPFPAPSVGRVAQHRAPV
jgi:hypothetical protein